MRGGDDQEGRGGRWVVFLVAYKVSSDMMRWSMGVPDRVSLI